MRLSTKGRYAVAAMVDLAKHTTAHKPITLTEIAQRQKLPFAYLEQLFCKLKKAGLVQGYRGHTGGYLLAKTSADISINDIITAVEEPIQVTTCKGDGISCQGGTHLCQTHHLWENLGCYIKTYLKGISLQNVCQKNSQSL